MLLLNDEGALQFVDDLLLLPFEILDHPLIVIDLFLSVAYFPFVA